jgi:hypothetical protein
MEKRNLLWHDMITILGSTVGAVALDVMPDIMDGR